MGKTYIDTVKYLIKAEMEIDGIVERPDVVGAIFGQTEGLLGDELDLRELQKSGRIGRIEVQIETKSGKSVGTIEVPSSLDADETSAIAAALEQIKRVGPSESHITVNTIEDTRKNKRDQVLERAKEIRQSMMRGSRPESKEISKSIRESVRKDELRKYGPEGLAAGPIIDESEELIVVEGRADVINLLKSNIKNVISLHGKKVPETVRDLSEEKIITLFVDGDRGGDLVVKQLNNEGDVDYVAKAPAGKEVEELTQKEILKCLRTKKSIEQFLGEMESNSKSKRRSKTKKKTKKKKTKKKAKKTKKSRKSKKTKKSKKDKKKSQFKGIMKNLEGTLKGVIVNEEDETVAKVDVKDLKDEIKKHDDIKAVVFDGIITQQLAKIAKKNKVDYLVGTKKGKVRKPRGVELITI